MRYKHNLRALGADIFLEFGKYVDGMQVVRLAQLLNVNLDILSNDGNRGTFTTIEYLTLISDDIDDYHRILNLLYPKVGGNVLIYHVKKEHICILQLLTTKCRSYFNQTHLIAAIRTRNVDIVQIVLNNRLQNSDKMSGACTEWFYETLKEIIKINAFEILRILIKAFNIPTKTVIYYARKALDNRCEGSVDLYYHLGTDMRDSIAFQRINNIILLKSLDENGLFKPDRVQVLKSAGIHFSDEKLVAQTNNVELVKWIITFFDSICRQQNLDDLFMITTKHAVDASLWMANEGLISKYGIRVNSIEALRVLSCAGYNVRYDSTALAKTVEDQKWYMNTFPTVKSWVDHEGLRDLLINGRTDMFILMFKAFKSTNKNLDEFFIHGNPTIIKFLLSEGIKMKNINTIMDYKMLNGDLDSLKYIHELFPQIYSYSIVLTPSPEVFKWMYDTLPWVKDNIKNIMHMFILQNKIELVKLCAPQYVSFDFKDNKAIKDNMYCYDIELRDMIIDMEKNSS